MTESVDLKIEERKNKIKNWLTNPYNLIFIGLLIIAFLIRLHYLNLTQTQPLWWDESEYALKARHFAFGTPDTGWAQEREIVLPFLFSLLFKIGLGEIGIRFIQLLMSVATVALTYVTLSKFLDKEKAVLATFMMSLFWLQLFFSQRILLYPWAVLLFLLISWTFYKGYFENNKKWLYAFGIISGISVYTYFSTGFLLFGIFVFLLISERRAIFKHKDLWICFGLFLLAVLPFAISSQLTFGFPIPRLKIGTIAIATENGPGLKMIFGFITMMPRLIGKTAFVLWLISIVYFIAKFAIGYDVYLKSKNKKVMSELYLFFAFFWPLLFYTIFAMRAGSPSGDGFQDAFILSTFPFIFAFVSNILFEFKKFVSKAEYKWVFGAVLILFVVLYSAYHLPYATSTIKNKLSSYDSVKYGGIWIKENSNKEDVVISRSVPQNTYYSERATYTYPKTQVEFETLMKEKNPRFLVDSIWENTPSWVREYIPANNATLRPVQVYYLDAQKTQPSLVIYEVTK